MTSQFHALPLGAGEAFLLETDHGGKRWVILVDSGNLDDGTPHPLVKAIHDLDGDDTKIRHIDTAICTHEDRDHSRGFESFADHWVSAGRTIGEFWLPGRWSAALPKALMDPFGFAGSLWNGASEAYEKMSDRSLNWQKNSTDEMIIRSLAQKSMPDNLFSASVDDEPKSPTERDPKEESSEQRETRVAQSLGLSYDQLLVIDTALEESERPPSHVLRQIAVQATQFPPVYWVKKTL